MEVVASEYKAILLDLKKKIRGSQQRAIQSVNHELVLLYWNIGHVILQQQSQRDWGVKIIDTLSADLKKSFPNVKGFSVRNLKYMRQFTYNYSDRVFVQETLAQLNWYKTVLQGDIYAPFPAKNPYWTLFGENNQSRSQQFTPAS